MGNEKRICSEINLWMHIFVLSRKVRDLKDSAHYLPLEVLMARIEEVYDELEKMLTFLQLDEADATKRQELDA